MTDYIDDVSAIGKREDIRKGIRNCRKMEKYQFNYGLDKTKYKVIEGFLPYSFCYRFNFNLTSRVCGWVDCDVMLWQG